MNANTELLTIKEFAQAAGVSRQYVYTLLDSDLTEYVKLVDSKKYITQAGLNYYLSSKLSSKVSSNLTKSVNQLDNSLDNSKSSVAADLSENVSSNLSSNLTTDLTTILQATIDTLQKQLDTKDSQIEALNEQLRTKDMQIAELNERLKNEQQLHKNAQELHAGQLMLTDKKKPGLFDRLFKKKQAAASDPGDDPTGDTPADDNGSGTR